MLRDREVEFGAVLGACGALLVCSTGLFVSWQLVT